MQDRFKKILEEKGLNAQKAAKIIGIDASAVSHIINGRRRPGFDVLQKLCNALPDINLNWLVNGQGSMYITTLPSENSSDETKNELFSNEEELLNDNVAENEVYKNDDVHVNSNILDKTNTITNLINKDNVINKKRVKLVIVVYDDGSVENFTSK